MNNHNPIQLRHWKADDAAQLSTLGNNLNIAQNMADSFPHPYLIENANQFIAFTQEQNPQRIFAIEYQHELAGGIGLHPQQDIMRKNMEIGYWLGEPFWGKGIISAAIPMIVEYGFNTFDITRIFARTFGRNKASQKVLIKAGFSLEATFEQTIFKNGVFEDEHIYAIRRNK